MYTGKWRISKVICDMAQDGVGCKKKKEKGQKFLQASANTLYQPKEVFASQSSHVYDSFFTKLLSCTCNKQLMGIVP